MNVCMREFEINIETYIYIASFGRALWQTTENKTREDVEREGNLCESDRISSDESMCVRATSKREREREQSAW